MEAVSGHDKKDSIQETCRNLKEIEVDFHMCLKRLTPKSSTPKEVSVTGFEPASPDPKSGALSVRPHALG